MESLSSQIELMSEELQREFDNNKLLEQKCEEYLSQLQKSAQIIENTREKHATVVEALELRASEVEKAFQESHDRLVQAENEISRIMDDNQQLLVLVRNEAEAKSRAKEEAKEKDFIIQDLNKQLR